MNPNEKNKKSQLVLLDQSNSNGPIDAKMDGSLFEEKPSFKMLGLTFSCKLNWGFYVISKKNGALIRSVKFLSHEVVLYLYKCTIRPCLLRNYLEKLNDNEKKLCVKEVKNNFIYKESIA